MVLESQASWKIVAEINSLEPTDQVYMEGL